jgi:hypothetical protein
MAPRPVFPLPAVAFESRGHRRGHYDRAAKEAVGFCTLRNPLWPALIRRLDQFFGI